MYCHKLLKIKRGLFNQVVIAWSGCFAYWGRNCLRDVLESQSVNYNKSDIGMKWMQVHQPTSQLGQSD